MASRTAKGRGTQVPGRGTGVLLLWAADRLGIKVRADRLRAADRRGRSPFTCLGCGEPLVPHLGDVRARHFAHLPGSRCPLGAPETALHLDGKERLLALCAAAFAGAREVTLLARCGGCRRALPLALAAAGDAAEGEAAVERREPQASSRPLRVDVLVRARGRPALAFEVRVTHAVAPEKEAALTAAGIPFVEIDARAEWEREGERGTEIACARSGGFPPCPACAALASAEADRAEGGEAAEVAELEAYRARGLFGPHLRVSEVGGRSPEDDNWAALPRRFRCPECGTRALEAGERLARHRCPLAGARPVAWRTRGGETVELSWWRRDE